MEYYSSNEKRPHDYLKTIDLTGCEDMVAPFPIGGRTFIIKIAIVNKGKNRDYFLDCESQSVMDEWISELAEVCGFTAGICIENLLTITMHELPAMCLSVYTLVLVSI